MRLALTWPLSMSWAYSPNVTVNWSMGCGVQSPHAMAAIGISPALFDTRADGTARRESYRQLLHTCVQPWVLRFEAEARTKLMAPGLHINLDALFAADLAGRARSFGALVKGGMAIERAAALSGLMLPDDDS